MELWHRLPLRLITVFLYEYPGSDNISEQLNVLKSKLANTGLSAHCPPAYTVSLKTI